jgi:2-dehydro-3-deoxygluconokinase
MSYDVVAVGEAMLRLWVPVGERLEQAPAFKVSVAGAEANVAMAAARMGARSAWLSALPRNSLGRRAAREIAAHGVDVSHVRWLDDARMGVYFVELSVPPRPTTVLYDRAGSAAALMNSASIDWPVIEESHLVHISGITPALSLSAQEMSLELVRRARDAHTLVSIDVNYRPLMWEPDQCRAVMIEMARCADLLITTAEDARDVFALEGEPTEVAGALTVLTGCHRVVVTVGSEGAHWLEGSREGFAPGYVDADVVDRIGAGDAFAAGALLGLLENDLEGGVARGLAMAALKLGIHGDQLSVTKEEVDRLIGGSGREVAR